MAYGGPGVVGLGPHHDKVAGLIAEFALRIDPVRKHVRLDAPGAGGISTSSPPRWKAAAGSWGRW
jgi:hypothetical protein